MLKKYQNTKTIYSGDIYCRRLCDDKKKNTTKQKKNKIKTERFRFS